MGQSNSQPSSDACPVDHQAREAWLKAGQQPPHPIPSNPETSCPVDDKAREVWLQTAQQSQTQSQGSPSNRPSIASGSAFPRPKFANTRLNTDREISTIPRGGLLATTETPATSPQPPSPYARAASSSATAAAAHGALSPNAMTSDPHTSTTGHWIYPSEQMFFDAMRRKQYNPEARDMSSIIPIHNAVNERTWHDILAWERKADPRTWEKCGGPKLISFAGDSTKLTPRARWKMIMGYQKPFDRHDWVVERCGQRVEYVIDYYQGRGPAGPLSFYLDVRPKLNSFEGCRMRFVRYWGFGG